ncbi:DUF6705 family protein [Flavobacterium sp. WV_118_3]|jgi:hypothetical protein|uniref:DUF6705 family protein n=1 Tax=Flavobacterium sp. WV_118_3 TaxID=3151764 RepID=UPI002C992E61|nr:hypothetical protein [Flavobacterium sp.]
MKNIFIITILLLSITGCSQTFPLYLAHSQEAGKYYKDIDNDLNKFQGTWKYTNGSTSLTIVLRKKTQVVNPFRNFTTDMLIGEYSYIHNGIQQANTIGLMESNSSTYGGNNIYGATLGKCDECPTGGKNLVFLSFSDPAASYLNSQMSVKYYVENGIEKIKIGLKPENYVHTGELPALPSGYVPVPIDKYILIKQP